MIAEINDVKSKFSLGDLKLGVKVISENGELQSKVVEYSREEQIVRADAGYYALEQVTIPAVSGEFDVASVYNEDGTQDIYISDEGELNIEEPLQTKNVIPEIQAQEIVADEDYYALGKVVVGAVTKDIDENIKPENIKQGVSILGVEGIMEEPPFEPKFAQLINGTITEITEEDLKDNTKINDYAFYNQTNLVKVELPDTIKSIGERAFNGCKNLQHINLDNVIEISGGAFLNCFYNYPRPIFLKSNVKITGAPFNTSGITKFKGYGIISTSADGNLFDNCSNLNYVEFNEGFKTLTERAFHSKALKTLVLPSTTTSTSNFYRVGNITNLIVKAEAPPTLNSTGYMGNIKNIFIPYATMGNYAEATNWATLVNKHYPLVNAYTDLLTIDTATYTKACVVGNDLGIEDENNYKTYNYTNGEWIAE